jgi:hypothetical protein
VWVTCYEAMVVSVSFAVRSAVGYWLLGYAIKRNTHTHTH